MEEKKLNIKPGLFKQGVQFNKNPIMEFFVTTLNESGIPTRFATKDEWNRADRRALGLEIQGLATDQVRFMDEGREGLTWCGLVVFENPLEYDPETKQIIESPLSDKISKIWANT